MKRTKRADKKLKVFMCFLLCISLIFVCSCKKDEEQQTTVAVVNQDESVYENLTDDTLWLSVYNVDTFNPIFTTSKSIADVSFLMYDPLFVMDESMKAAPRLASGYEVSQDGLAYTVFLRENCQFHDGTSFDSSHVLYTISQIRMRGAICEYYNNILNIKDAYAQNQNTIVITLNTPEPLFINNLCFPIIKSGTAEKVSEPIGTGPYKFVRSTLTRAMYFEANENYFWQKAAMKNAVITIVPDFENQIYALKYRRTDTICVTSDELEKYNTGANRVYYNNLSLTFMGINSENEFLSYGAARRAISLCMDRNEMVNSILFGNGESAVLPYPAQSFIYPEKYKEIRKDASRAENELLQAGFAKNENGIYSYRNDLGNEVLARIEILVNSENEKRATAAQKAADNLKSAGIEAVVVKTDFDTYEARIGAGQYDVYIGEVLIDNSFNTDLLFGPEAVYSRCLTQSLSAAIEKKKNAVGEESIINSYGELCDVFVNAAPVVCLYFKRDAMLINEGLDIKGEPVCGNEFANVFSWVK